MPTARQALFFSQKQRCGRPVLNVSLHCQLGGTGTSARGCAVSGLPRLFLSLCPAAPPSQLAKLFGSTGLSQTQVVCELRFHDPMCPSDSARSPSRESPALSLGEPKRVRRSQSSQDKDAVRRYRAPGDVRLPRRPSPNRAGANIMWLGKPPITGYYRFSASDTARVTRSCQCVIAYSSDACSGVLCLGAWLYFSYGSSEPVVSFPYFAWRPLYL